VKCNNQAQTVEIEEELTDASVDDVREALPDGSPRYYHYFLYLEHFKIIILADWYSTELSDQITLPV